MQLPNQKIFAETWLGPFGRERQTAGAGLFPDRLAAGLAGLRARSTTDLTLLAIVVLICLRVTLAAVLPLSFDEAYYWLWSKHLAPGYLEHPAAIAFAIRAGTFLFGDTEFGVRFVPLLASVLASWAVWRAAAVMLSDTTAGAIASLFFNATLMVAAEGMGATPDSLLLAAAAMLLWSIAELERTQDGRWWFVAGTAAGLAIATKYTGIFLCVSLAVWLLASAVFRQGRQVIVWLRTIWPWAGAAIALAIFAPTLYWNASHGFISFRFQGSRALVDHPGARYLLEFLAGQVALASPVILALAAMSFWRNIKFRNAGQSLHFVALVFCLPLMFFMLHSLHDRVQGDWPCFAYPALAILAAKSYREIELADTPSRATRLMRASAIPIAALILAVAYAQAFFAVIPIGRGDPIARMTAVGFEPVAEKIAAYAAKYHARAIVTTNYPATSWLRFYQRTRLPVVQIADDHRFLSSPPATDRMLDGTLLYVTQHPRREFPAVRAHFSSAVSSGVFVRSRNGHQIDEFAIYIVHGLRGAPPGRVP